MRSVKIPFTLFVIFSLFFLASCTEKQWANSPSWWKNSQNVITPPVSTQWKQTSKSITYRTDHGHHQATVNFVLEMNSDNTISTVTADMTIGDRESAEYVSNFNTRINSMVIWKKKSELSLSAVWWASDTTDAFMQVLNTL